MIAVEKFWCSSPSKPTVIQDAFHDILGLLISSSWWPRQFIETAFSVSSSQGQFYEVVCSNKLSSSFAEKADAH
jgi:hypothetical protein